MLKKKKRSVDRARPASGPRLKLSTQAPEKKAAMKRLYLDMKHVSRIPDVFRLTAEEINHLAGMNLGNYVFRHALLNVLADLNTFEPVIGKEYRQIVADGTPVESVIVSCANWLGQTAQDEAFNLGRAQMVEMVDAPVVAFGLGAQASGLQHDKPVPLGPNTIRLAKALSEKSAQISVRDELTRRTLEAVGVHNATVTGCPSNYLNCDPGLGATLAKRAAAVDLNDWKNVRTAISEVTGGHASSGAIFKQQMRMLDETPAFYVVQTPDFVHFVLGERSRITPYYRENNPFINQPNKLTQVLKAKTLHFTDVDSWLGFCRTCDISFGMRIHGTMVPFHSGIPAILIAHDSRTVGLADTMHIPWISPEDYLELSAEGPQKLFKVFVEKVQGYDENRAKLAVVMRDFLLANKLNPSDALLGLIPDEKPDEKQA